MKRRSVLLPTLLAFGLAMVIGLEVMQNGLVETADLAAPRRPPPAAAPPRGAEGRPGIALDSSLARPLFSPDRRPAPAAAGQAAGPQAPRLAAILITPEGRQAIFDVGGRSVVAREGGLVGALLVIAIAEGQVSVTGPQGPAVLRLSFAPGAPAGAAVPVAPAAGGPTPSGLDILRNAARQAPPPPPGSPPAPVPGVEQTGIERSGGLATPPGGALPRPAESPSRR